MSQSLKNVQTLRPIIDPAAYPWLADPTGTADATAAFNAAFAIARTNGAEVRPTPGKYNFLGSLNPAGVCLRGPGVFTRETEDYTTRGVVFLHNGSVPLFAPAAAANAPSGTGWVCEGITFYDPNQPGTNVNPVVRPPLIEPVGAARAVDITFRDNAVVNCYTFLSVQPGSLLGDVRILDNRIYAIAFLFLIEADGPEVMYVSGNMFSPGVYQTYAVFSNSARLAIWSGANAIAWAVNPTGSNSIDGLKSCNNLYFGFFAVFAVDSGRIDLGTSTGDNFDATNRLVLTRGTGGIEGLTFSGGSLYCYENAGPGNPRTGRALGFELTSSGTCKITVSGMRCELSDGDWVVDIATGPTIFAFDGHLGPFGQASGATGDHYGFRIDNPQAEYNIKSPKVVASYADTIGVSVVEAAEVLVTGVAFNGLKLPVQLDAAISSGSRITLTGCMSRNTTGAKSVDSAAPVGVAFDCGSRWDQPSDITPSV